MKKLGILFFAIFIASMAFSQTRVATKVGFVNYGLIRDTLPQTDTFEMAIQQRTLQYQQAIAEIEKNIVRKQKASDTLAGGLKELFMQDIAEQKQKLDQIYQEAEYVIGSFQEEAVFSLNSIITEAVNKIAKVKSYTIILDSSSGSIVFGMPQDDLTKEVAKSLGITLQ